MRIRELLEGKYFNDQNYVKKTEEGRKIDYDLSEDLIYFMNHDDHAYRRHTHPAIVKCLDSHDRKKIAKSHVFEPAIKECYKLYIKKFPIRELPDSLNEKQLKNISDKIHEEVHKHIEDGKYKD
jgi:hypothetical protein